MSSTLEASVFMGKNYSDNLHSIKNTEDLTMKQKFDISEKLISEQMRSMECPTSVGKILQGNNYLVNDEEVISLSHAKGL